MATRLRSLTSEGFISSSETSRPTPGFNQTAVQCVQGLPPLDSVTDQSPDAAVKLDLYSAVRLHVQRGNFNFAEDSPVQYKCKYKTAHSAQADLPG
jgi:hypothetical protein